MKTCTKCNKEKEITEFYSQKQRDTKDSTKVWHYRDSLCKPCRSRYTTERRRNIKIRAIKYLGGKCEHCQGKFIPAVYDFHHKDPSMKDFSIGKQLRTFEAIKKELDKCILLCSNCHRTLHSLTQEEPVE